MSTVKIKTEPTTTTAAAAATATAVDVQVKLEPSLSTGDIKHEQHTSDIDTKVESDSEADSEEGEVKSENEDSDSDEDSSQETATSKKQRQFICKHPGCGRGFSSSSQLNMHQHEHRFQTELNIFGKTYTLTRQSLNGRWPCPIPDCTSTAKTVAVVSSHIRKYHGSTPGQQQHKQQQPQMEKTRNKIYFVDVDNFYVKGVRCGYHNTTGVFICYECRSVPECLLNHLQQKHGYDGKLIDNSTLPVSAVNTSANPNINQHTSNPHLASAINQPYQQQHQDIIQGWLCITSDCGYCGYTVQKKNDHKRSMHQSEQLSTVPALVLRLSSSKTQTTCFLVTRIDQASGAVTTSSSRVNQHKLDYSHNGLNTQSDNDDNANQNETTESSKQKRQWKCEQPNCGRSFNSCGQLSMHRREQKLETVINVRGMTFILTRQSSNDRWACPVPDCVATCKAVHNTRRHIGKFHSTSTKHKHANGEDDSDIQQQPTIKRRQYTIQYIKLNDFYIGGTRCGYHNTIGVFICHECRLVPECLLTHLQQQHGLDEKSIDKSVLPDSAANANADPNTNQHINNTHLAASISEPNGQQHPNIAHGWLCVTSDCDYCHCTKVLRRNHQYTDHRGELFSTVPALVLRLLYGKTQTSCFLITRLDTISNNVQSSSSESQYINEYDEDDGDELVLSDYGSDEDDIH